MPTNSAYYIYAEPWERAKSPDKNDSILKLKQEEEEKKKKKRNGQKPENVFTWS